MEISAIFFNRAGRVRSVWRLLVFAVALLFLIRFLMDFVRVLLLKVAGLPEAVLVESAWGWVLQAAIFLSAATLLGWWCGKLFEGLPARALGWGFHDNWLRDWLKGTLVGALSLLLATLVATIFGGFSFALNAAATFPAIGRTLLLSGLIFILAAAAEEAMFRGYPLQTMTRSGLAWLAILITSVLFSAGHLDNPNVVRGFTFVNTALAGIWLAVAYLRTRSLWFPLGVHWSWNWMMGAVLGLPVSGINHLTPNPLVRAEAIGPAWLTGGSYGIEGGAACTIALLASTVFIWRTGFLHATEEMKRFTDHEIPRWEQTPQTIQPQPFDNLPPQHSPADDERKV
jgi:membrane protease YdiL (CAAX protease family)